VNSTIDLGSSTAPFDDVYSSTNTINNTLTLNGSMYLNSSSTSSLIFSYYAGSAGSSSEGGIAIGFAHGNFQYYNGSTSTYWQFFDSNGYTCLKIANNGADGPIVLNNGSITVPSLTASSLLWNDSNKKISSVTVNDSNGNLAFSTGTLSFAQSPTFSNLTISSTGVTPLIINTTGSAAQVEFENNGTPEFTLNGANNTEPKFYIYNNNSVNKPLSINSTTSALSSLNSILDDGSGNMTVAGNMIVTGLSTGPNLMAYNTSGRLCECAAQSNLYFNQTGPNLFTLDTVQAIAQTSSPTFAGLTLANSSSVEVDVNVSGFPTWKLYFYDSSDATFSIYNTGTSNKPFLINRNTNTVKTLKNTLDDGSGDMSVAGNLTVSGTLNASFTHYRAQFAQLYQQNYNASNTGSISFTQTYSNSFPSSILTLSQSITPSWHSGTPSQSFDVFTNASSNTIYLFVTYSTVINAISSSSGYFYTAIQPPYLSVDAMVSQYFPCGFNFNMTASSIIPVTPGNSFYIAWLNDTSSSNTYSLSANLTIVLI